MLKLTQSAAQEIRRQAEKRGCSPHVRVGIKGGGCSGFSYIFEWAVVQMGQDIWVENGDVRILVDPKSAIYLEETELDFVTGIQGHGFKFKNPKVTGTCGCGESIQF